MKERKAFYCNAKVLLLFLVIYGHLLEKRIADSEIILWQYRAIYAVHIPLFAFLSGMFLKSEYACIKQMLSAIKWYIPCQLFAMVFYKLTEGREVSLLVPDWHLWYLLSLFFWAGICYFAVKVKNTKGKAAIIGFSVLLAVLCGYAEGGRLLSAARTVTFLPFVLAGCSLPGKTGFKKFRVFGSAIGVLALVTFTLLVPKVPVAFLYGADSYEMLEISSGALWRLVFLLLAAGIGFGILSLLPDRPLVLSRAGVDTMLVYLLHGPIVKIVRNVPMEPMLFCVLAPAIAAIIYGGIYLLRYKKAKQYRIVS